MKKQVVLAILDGWGIGKPDQTNPIHLVKPKTIEHLKHHYLSGSLQASGIAVGLPWGAVGNSEVGHLTIGAGKVIYQHYPRITLAIQEGTFFKNEAFLKAFSHAKKNDSWLNIAGVLTEGNIHAAFEHLTALIHFAKQEKLNKLSLHLFSDGKDSRPKSVLPLIEKLKQVLEEEGIGIISSISGRHFALDRDSHYDRTEQAYRVMIGLGHRREESITEVITEQYEAVSNDQHIPPFVVGKAAHPVSDNDALIFIDFREDSIRQIAESFILKDYDKFETKKIENLFTVTMTEYRKDFNSEVAFPSEEITHPLAKILSEAGKTQLQIAETEKYAHVTYFFNGYRDESFPKQEKALIASNNVESHASQPAMKAEAIAAKVIEGIENGTDFIVANFANADIIAHTGDFEAGIEAIKAVDLHLGRIVKICEEKGVYLVVTSDHGNAEVMRDRITGVPETRHDPSPVPLYVLGKEYKKEKSDEAVRQTQHEVIGILSDVAPTILDIFTLEKPKQMSGRSLLSILR